MSEQDVAEKSEDRKCKCKYDGNHCIDMSLGVGPDCAFCDRCPTCEMEDPYPRKSVKCPLKTGGNCDNLDAYWSNDCDSCIRSYVTE